VSFLRRLSLFAVTIAALPFLFVTAEPASKPSQDQIAQWVRQLGDDDFATREEASKKLYEAGEIAEAALREAMVGDNPEVTRRAGEIIDKFKWGLYPEAPKEIVDLVTRYRSSTPQGKNDVIRELLKAGPSASRTLLKIVDAEEDSTIRYGVFKFGHDELAQQAPQRIADEKYGDLERLIDLLVTADVERGVGFYAAYWQMRGKLDERIAHLKTMKGMGLDVKKTWEIIAYLYRAKGDLAAAREAAEKADKPALVEALLAEGGEWKKLASRKLLDDAEPGAEQLGARATYRRLAGDAKGFDEALADLRKSADAERLLGPEHIHLAKVLFLNDRSADAVDVLVRSPYLNLPTMAFEVLIAQMKFKEALEFADQAKTAGSEQAPVLEILKARTLYLLGEKEKATAIFARYGGMIIDGKIDVSWIETLIESEVRVGLLDQAAEHAAKALDAAAFDAMRDRLMPKLFPKNSETAEVLWLVLHGLVKDTKVIVRMEAGEAMKRLRDHMAGKAAAGQLADLLAQGEKDIANNLTPDLVPKWRLALAEAALLAKDDSLARSLLVKADSVAALLRLGDLDAEQKEWDKAAEHYWQAWKKEPSQPLAYYLNGWALKQAGQEKEGKKRMEQSHWMPLGDGAARFAFLRSLLERRHFDAVEREGELMLRLNPPGWQFASEGMRQVALAAMRRKDYLVAAQLQERSMLVCLKSGVAYSQSAAYLWVPALVHRLRAEGYSVAGDFDAARRETDLCWTALPGDALVPIEIVPMWDKAGRKKEATELFEKYLAVQQKLCDAYPKSTVGHNGVAWLSACCRRNLESAQKHAKTAVDLDPKNAGVLDTLAEVEFQLGNKDAAIEAQTKAVALEPKRAYFRKQLKRLEGGDLTAERPSEYDDE
jgi:tetratricopeptide (TPR) repeat protein